MQYINLELRGASPAMKIYNIYHKMDIVRGVYCRYIQIYLPDIPPWRGIIFHSASPLQGLCLWYSDRDGRSRLARWWRLDGPPRHVNIGYTDCLATLATGRLSKSTGIFWLSKNTGYWMLRKLNHHSTITLMTNCLYIRPACLIHMVRQHEMGTARHVSITNCLCKD